MRLLVPWRQPSRIEAGTTAIIIANDFVDVYEFGPAEKALLRQWDWEHRDVPVGSFELSQRVRVRAKARAADKVDAVNRAPEFNPSDV